MKSHGHCTNKQNHGSLTYTSYVSMLKRCCKQYTNSYSQYGGAGIKVCERWLIGFENFLKDMGERPSKHHSLDRYPNKNGNYTPQNCRWATIKEQNRNRRDNMYITYMGRTMILKDWAIELNRRYGQITYWLNKGESFDWIYGHFINKPRNKSPKRQNKTITK